MTRYTEEFKLAVVEDYLGGRDGYREVSRRRGVDHGTLREWIGSYRRHGPGGLRKKYDSYSGEYKLLVLKHMWDNRLSYRETMAVFNISGRACLKGWEKAYRRGGVGALIPRRKGRPKSMSDPGKTEPPPSTNAEQPTREELLAELSRLRMENAYLKKVEALARAKQAPKERK